MGARAHLDRAADGRARRHHREHRASLHPELPGHLQRQPAVDRHRLRARLRRVPAARRSARRPLRTTPHLHGRPGDLRDRLAARWPRAERGTAARGPWPAGLRCGAGLPRRPGADHHDLPGRTGPQPRLRDLRGHVRRRCGGRPDPRRLAHRSAPRHRRPVHRGLAPHLPDQHPDRHHRRTVRTAGAGRVRAPPRRARHPGRHHRHRRPARHRLRPEPGRTARLGQHPGPSSAWSSARCCS